MNLPTDVSAFLKPDETALQLYSRTWTEPLPTSLFFLPSVRPGDVTEVAGPSGCGKTSLLLQVAVNTILPSKWQQYRLGGLQENVVFIDMDNKFDILRLMQILHTRVLSTLQQDTEQDQSDVMNAIVHASLARFHLVRCGSSLELLAFLRTARPLVARLQAEQGLHLLLIDNIAAFHWLDAAVKPGNDARATATLTTSVVHSNAAASIRMLAKQLKQSILVTKHAFRNPAPGREGNELWQQREVMSRGWTEVVSQRLLLQHLGGGVGGLPLKLAAKWDKPVSHQTHTFAITDAGIAPSTW